MMNFLDEDPIAQWAAQLNRLGRLCDEQAEREGLFVRRLGPQPRPSRKLRQLQAVWRRLARQIPAKE